jgi:hypothetical protein
VVTAVDGDPGPPEWLPPSARDLELFAKRHHQAFGSALDPELPKAPCFYTFLYLFERVELEVLFGLLRE